MIEEKKLRMLWSLHCFFKAVFRLCVDIDTVHFDLFSCFSGNVYSNSCVLISAEKGFLQKFLWKYNMAPMKLTEKKIYIWNFNMAILKNFSNFTWRDTIKFWLWLNKIYKIQGKEIKHRNYVILKQFPAEYLHI